MLSQPLDPQRHTFHSHELITVVHQAIQYLDNTPVHPLPPGAGFIGVGVYAVYYLGAWEHYEPIARKNRQECQQPIYVGKAVPPGWRTARTPETENTRALYRRLGEHARSVEQAGNLDLGDFRCRFIILTRVDTTLIAPIEAELIRTYTPLWNTVVDGFGNHDPGKGRYAQARSEWDAIHPGRVWAERLRGATPDVANVVGQIRRATR